MFQVVKLDTLQILLNSLHALNIKKGPNKLNFFLLGKDFLFGFWLWGRIQSKELDPQIS